MNLKHSHGVDFSIVSILCVSDKTLLHSTARSLPCHKPVTGEYQIHTYPK